MWARCFSCSPSMAGIALVVVLVTPLSLFVASFIARRSHSMFREQSTARGELAGYVEEMVGNQKVVKAFSLRRAGAGSLRGDQRPALRLRRQGAVLFLHDQPSHPVCKRGGVRGGGDYRRSQRHPGGLSVGQISCFLTYANQYTKPFNEMTGVLTQLQTAFASAQTGVCCARRAEESPDAEEPKPQTATAGSAAEHVLFLPTGRAAD